MANVCSLDLHWYRKMRQRALSPAQRGLQAPLHDGHGNPRSVGPLAEAILYSLDVPSEKLLIASFEGESARYLSVTFGSPSRIMRCTMISDLKTIVHVESRNRFCKARKISATPASPAWVATRICSTYLAFGGASCGRSFQVSWRSRLPMGSSSCSDSCLDFRPTLHRLLERHLPRARKSSPGLIRLVWTF